MTINKKEHLSALLDGEAGDFEQRRLLDEIQKDDEMRNSYANYALIGEMMRTPSSSKANIASNNFLDSLNAKLEQETGFIESSTPSIANNDSVYEYPNQKKKNGRIIGFAIAASVATLAVVGALNLAPMGQQHEQTLPLASSPIINDEITDINTLASVDIPAQEDDKWQYDPEIQAQIRHYVNEHNKYTSITGIVPTIRAASFKTGF